MSEHRSSDPPPVGPPDPAASGSAPAAPVEPAAAARSQRIEAGAESSAPKPEATTASATGRSADGSDVVLLGAPTSDGQGVGVVRVRDGSAELGVLQPLRHGKPIRGEVVTLHPRKEHPRICDVEVELAGPKVARARSGPPQVATARYRANWDAIWARKPDGDEPS